MNLTSQILIEAKDCFPIPCTEEESKALFYFVSEVAPKIYHFSTTNNEEEPIVYFDYTKRQWFANRYIGECEFVFNNQIYVIKINPRFGDELLLKLFEYIYSSKLPPSYHALVEKNSVDIHKLLISLIWVSLLKKALRHGLFKVNRKVKEVGATIRGKFLIKQSLIDIKVKNRLHYEYTFKEIDNVPNKIIFKAYQILKKHYFLNDSLLSNTIKSDFIKLSALSGAKLKIEPIEYNKIRYSNLYAGYKPLIDLSWKLINAKEIGIESSTFLGNSFFLDMAEVWELFVHRTLTKNMVPKGWEILQNDYEIYSNSFFKRKIIPDLVLQKNEKVLVVDAKYKRMCFEKKDVDRDDIFQIHTYSYYFDEPDKVVFATLVYPFESEKEGALNKQLLFNKPEHKNSFFIEGINVKNASLFEVNIANFINSMSDKTNGS